MPTTDDLKNLDRLDQVVLGAGVLGLIVSIFFPIWGVSVNVKGLGGGGNSTSAWHGLAAFGMLLVLVATAIAAVRVFAAANLPKMPIGVNLLTFVLSALGTVIVIIRELTYPHASLPGYSYGVKWGGYLLFILLIVQAVAAFLLFKKSGEVMPDFKAMQANRAAGGPTPPPPVYGTPPVATYPPATPTPAGDYTLDDSTPPPPSA
ncbi:MAG: hypothetical protein QOJ11_2149 [Frankiales bacterium]|jgi:hypothetical protein|nr:hypothetical protein [Frankiales bacterium]